METCPLEETLNATPDLNDERYLVGLIAEETRLLREQIQRQTSASDDGAMDALIDYLAATSVRLSVVEQLLASDTFLLEKAAAGRRPPLILPATSLGNAPNLLLAEPAADGVPVRWTGPEPTTTLMLRLPRYQTYELAIRVADPADAGVPRGLTMSIDGRRCHHLVRHYYGGPCLIGRLPKRQRSPEHTRIDITLPAGTPPRAMAIREVRVVYRPDLLRRLLRFLHWQKLATRLRG